MSEHEQVRRSFKAESHRAASVLKLAGRLYLLIQVALALGSLVIFYSTAETGADTSRLLLALLGSATAIVQSVLIYAAAHGLAVLIEHAVDLRREEAS